MSLFHVFKLVTELVHNGNVFLTSAEKKMIRPKVIVVRAILKLISILFHAFRWNNLREMVDQKRDEITVAHGFQNFNIECNETIVSLR